MVFLRINKIRNLGKKGDQKGSPTSSPEEESPARSSLFEQWVQETVESLPQELKDRLENVAILVEETPPPSEDWVKKGEELLGLYHGISHKDRGFWYGNVLPDRIVIYRKPLERISSNLQELRENIRLTVLHEIGHYFGFDEEDLKRFEERKF